MTTQATLDADGSATRTEPSGTVVLEGVTRRFGETKAVDNLSLRVEAGEFLSLLGPSGCGKTTTLRMLAGFEHPDAGDIRISGTSVLGVPPYKRDVNTVFQAYALFPHMSVAENVAYGLQQKRVPRAEVRVRVAEALDLVQMRSFADRKSTQLSGGQQQRIALARALVNKPSVLLLDEHLGALDRQLREEMQLELKLLQSQLGITFVFVTHDQGEALSMSDRIAVMREGRIEQHADADTIYSRPGSAYVAAFIGQQNFVAGTLTSDGKAVDTGIGALKAARIDPALKSGDAAQAAIRPEFVRVTPAAEPAPAGTQGADGTLIGLAHLGESMQYLVQLDAGQSILSRRPTADAPSVAVGDAVRTSWKPEHVQVFPADGAEAAAGFVRPPETTHSHN